MFVELLSRISIGAILVCDFPLSKAFSFRACQMYRIVPALFDRLRLTTFPAVPSGVLFRDFLEVLAALLL